MLLSHFSHVPVCATLWMIAHQAPQSLDSPSKNTGVGCHYLLQSIFPTQKLNLRLLCLLHWQVGSLPPAPPSEVHTALNCFLVILKLELNTYTEESTQPLTSGWEKVPELTQNPRVPDPEGPQTQTPPRLSGTLRATEHTQGGRAARWLPDCTSSGRPCLFHSVPGSPGLGRVGPPEHLSAAGDELGVPLAAFGGLEGRAWSCRGRWGSPQWGSSKGTRWNSSSWTPAHGGPTVPQPPCKCKSCRRSQPSNLGGVCGRDLCPGETC